MSEQLGRMAMSALRRAASHLRLYGSDHPLSEAAFAETARAATALARSGERSVLTLLEDALYLDRDLLAATSLEFNGMIRVMETADVESITFVGTVHPGDVAVLAALLDGAEHTDPPNGTVIINEKPYSAADLQGSEIAELRRAYAGSLDTLRSIGTAVRMGSDFSLSPATDAVRSLLEQSLSQPGASLLLATVKSHHEYTFFHSVNTCILSLALGRLAGLDESDQLLLGVGALLHDIGKIGVSAAILSHPGRLSPEQWEEIKLHPQIGAQAILAAATSGQEVAGAVAFEHHARFDGSGYPKLTYFSDHEDNGEGHHGPHRSPLHFFSRLVSVADTYDAITTRRSYRRAETPTRALHVLLTGSGSSYDPDFVHAFIHMMGVYPPGSLLRLRGGRVAMVTQPSFEPGGLPPAVIVVDGSGHTIESPEPVTYGFDEIVDQLSPGRVGIDPASILERLGVSQIPLP